MGIPKKKKMTSDFPAHLEEYVRRNPKVTEIKCVRLTRETCKLLYELFSALDANKNGGLDAQDFMHFVGGMKKFQILRDKLDFNGDGLIEFDEFVEGMTKLAQDTTPDNIEVRPKFTLADYLQQFEALSNHRLQVFAKEMVDFVNAR